MEPRQEQQMQRPMPEVPEDMTETMPEEDDMEGMEEATPEEQAQYDDTMRAAMEALYGEQQFALFVDMLDKYKSNPAEGIARAAVAVVDTVEQQSGATEQAVVEGVFQELVEQMVDVADKMGMEVAEEQLQEAFSLSLQYFFEAHPERMDEQAAMDAAQQYGG